MTLWPRVLYADPSRARSQSEIRREFADRIRAYLHEHDPMGTGIKTAVSTVLGHLPPWEEVRT
jgi:hypothetical protein